MTTTSSQHDAEHSSDLESLDDDAFLDELFDRAVGSSAGALQELESLARARPHLHGSVEDLIRAAQSIAVGRSADAPRIEGYTLVRELGRGAMGSVWLAQQETLAGRWVALKLLPHASSMSHRARERFLAEARALARVPHDNVVAIHDVIEHGDVCAYAMEWVEGHSFAELIAHVESRTDSHDSATRAEAAVRFLTGTETGKLALQTSSWPQLVARIGRDIARALTAVHGIGLVHRDVKPSNILLRRDGSALLSDFGLVHDLESSMHTLTGEFVGTLAFASPEVLRGDHKAVDARSDVFSLGATLYQALTFELPFGRASAASVQARAETGRFTPPRKLDPRLPRELETIVVKALDPDPARRYADATELADDLERLLALQPIRAKRAGVVARTFKTMRRNSQTLYGSIAGIALGVVAAAALGWWLYDRARRPELVAEHLKRARFELIGMALANQPLIGQSKQRELRASIYLELPPQSELPRYRRALAEYDRALELAPDRESLHLERDVLAVLLTAADEGELGVDDSDDPRRYVRLSEFLSGECPNLAAATHELAARTLDSERFWNLVSTGNASDRKAFGLFGFLGGHASLALTAWQTLDLESESDPLIDGLIGNAYLHDGRLELAYVRLMRALDAYPDSAQLNVAVADVSLRLGDAAVARRLLGRCDRSQFDPRDSTFQRVSADLAWLEGRTADARLAYADIPASPGNPICRLRLAVMDEQGGNWRGAWPVYLDLALYVRHWMEPRFGFQRCAESWWRDLTGAQRLDAVREMAALAPSEARISDVRQSSDSNTQTADRERQVEAFGTSQLLVSLNFWQRFPTRPYAPALPLSAPFLWRNELKRDAHSEDPLPTDSLLGLRCTADLVRSDALWRALPRSLREQLLVAAYAIDCKVAASPAQDRAGAIAATALGRCAHAVLGVLAAARQRHGQKVTSSASDVLNVANAPSGSR